MVSPASGGDARGSARAGLIFFGRALSLRLVTRRVAGSNPVTPALFSRRMLQRLYYTAEKGVARVGRRRSRLPLRPTRAGTSFQQRALEARLLAHHEERLGRGTPAVLPGWGAAALALRGVASGRAIGIGPPDPGVEGRRNFFASRCKQATSCPGGDWAWPSHACAVSAVKAAAGALHDRTLARVRGRVHPPGQA